MSSANPIKSFANFVISTGLVSKSAKHRRAYAVVSNTPPMQSYIFWALYIESKEVKANTINKQVFIKFNSTILFYLIII